MKWYAYILKCGNGSYYVGHSSDLDKRYVRYVNKAGARHTAQNGVEGLLYYEIFQLEIEAIRREQQIKRWSRAKKEALIAGDINQLHNLSRSHDCRKECIKFVNS